MKKIGLNGTWSLSWNTLREGSLEACLERHRAGKTIPAAVPGSVHESLIGAGLIEDPVIGLNAKKCGWILDNEWWFVREFDADRLPPGSRTFLRFDGIDLTGKIWLNGVLLGTTDNAFVEFRFDATDAFKTGTNTLVVRLDEGIESVRSKPLDFTKRSWNNDQPYRAWMRKPQFCYGWDWTVNLPTLGIWRSVQLEQYETARISDAFIRLETGPAGIRDAKEVGLAVSTGIESFKKTGLKLECSIFPDPKRAGKAGKPSARTSVKISGPQTDFKMTIRDPELWWPVGLGRPYLYSVVLKLKDSAGKTVDERRFNYGIRTVGLEERELGKGHKSFTFLVNGEPFFAKGANWVPVDAVLGRITDEKYEKLIGLAGEAGVNMFRVWGGGIYESEAFFDRCDSLGIMVWHDFMYSCEYYPSFDAGFRRNIEREAELAIRRLRNRASLFGWAGNNEIQCMYQGTTRWHPEWKLPFYGEDIYEKILPSLVGRLDPDRIYRPGCPYGGYPSDSGVEGDQHTWRFTHVGGHKDYLNLWMHTREETKFLSEFGVLGPMGIETARKSLPGGSVNTRSDEWHFHSNSYKKGLQTEILKKYFGSMAGWSLERYILSGQALQAELMRYIYEELRSRKFHCSGALMWSWSDSFGTNGWSLVDYYLKKKPAYFSFKRANTPLSTAWNGYCPQLFPEMRTWRKYYAENPKPLEVIVMNDTLADRTAALECEVMTFAGKVLRKGRRELRVPANSVRAGLSLNMDEIMKNPGSAGPDNIFIAAVLRENGRTVHENRYFPVPFKDLKLKKAKIACAKRKIGRAMVELRLKSDTFVWMAHLGSPDGVDPLENDFDLLPGRERIVRIRTADPGRFSPEISSMNPSTRIVMKKR